MAPVKTDYDDFKFIMTCIKHSPDKLKPNFEEVAKEIGAKSANACYHKHWGIMRKWGLTGSKKGPATSVKAPQPIAENADEASNDSNPSDEPPAKKRKRAGTKTKKLVKEEAVDKDAECLKEEECDQASL